MAYPDDITDDDALVKPRSLSLEDITGQPTAAVTGIKSVVPFRAAGWSDKNPDGTPKQNLWDPDAPTPSIERLKNKIGSLWSGGSQGIMDSVQRGADKALGVSPIPDKAQPIEKAADVFSQQNEPTKFQDFVPPAGSLVDKATTTVSAKSKEADSSDGAGKPIATTPSQVAAPPPTMEQPNSGFTAKSPGLFGVPGLLGELGSNIHNWTDQRRMMLMALAGGLAGQGNLSQRLGAGFTNAAATMPQQQALNNQNATLQALLKKGYSLEDARAIAGNPHLLQQVAPMAFGAKNWDWADIGYNQYQQPIKGWINKVTREVRDASGKPVQTGTSGSNTLQGTNSVSDGSSNQLHGEDYLKTLDPGRANIIRMIGQGRAQYPSGMILKTPYGQALQQDVAQAYPDMNEQTFPARKKAWTDWYGGGKHADAMGAIDQAATHGDALTYSFDKLGNLPGGRVVNAPLNYVGDALGIGKSGENFGATGMNIHALADELSKIWKTGTNSDAEVKAWEEKFPINGTLDQQKAAMRKAVELYDGGIEKLEKLRRDEFGPVADTLPPVVGPETGSRIAHIKQWANSGPAPSTAPRSGYQNAPAPGASAAPVRINNDDEFNRLPHGAMFVGPDNVPRRKP